MVKAKKSLKRGDKVSWMTSQGRTTGTVVRKQTARTKIKEHVVAASKAAPEFIVESAKSGKRAAHKAQGLRKVSK